MSRSKIVFDFDGTLVDVRAREHAIYTCLIKEMKLRPSHVLDIEMYWLMRRAETLDDILLETLGRLPPSVRSAYVKRRGDCIENRRFLKHDIAIQGSIATLCTLREKHDIVVVTSRHSCDNFLWELRRLTLDKVIDDAVNTSGKDKVQSIRQFGNVSYVVGDTEHDINAAKMLGLPSIAVLTGARSFHFLASLEPTYLLDTMNDMVEIVK